MPKVAGKGKGFFFFMEKTNTNTFLLLTHFCIIRSPSIGQIGEIPLKQTEK